MKDETNQKITLHVEGGVIHDIHGIPKGIEVEVIDYDTDGVEPERITSTKDGDAVISTYHSD